MKTKFTRFSVVFVVLMLLLGSAIAVGAQEKHANAQYTNPETSYQVMILDELSLLTESEQAKLVEDMMPLTQYGHAIFWTTDEYAYDAIDQARIKRKELYYFDSAAIFAINMGSRKLSIQTYGTIRDYVNDSKARSITDNVSQFATSKDYYSCSQEAFRQMNRVLEGGYISEPMKYTSYAVISAMLGLILALSIAFSRRFNPLRRVYQRASVMTAGSAVTGPIQAYEVKREKIYVSSGSSSGGSGCGGGSSCGGGGCGGGSSCGGGGCGGGGSSSF